MLKDNSVVEFLDKLASKDPVPGGGGAAAIASAMSCALSSMVFNLTVGKKAYNEMEDSLKAKVDNSLDLCAKDLIKYIDFIDKDADAFMTLMDAYKLAKDTDEEKVLRHNKINEGLFNSMMVPFNLAEKTLELMDTILIASKYGNKNVISDAGVAAFMAIASIESCILNVKINLSFINNADTEKDMLAKCEAIMAKALALKEDILNNVNNKIYS